ncbi:MAG: 3-dehydroquinate synthase [Candidatus Omnitrophota bacterium]|nr:3-dehydroquinate synthase [Candidatus Omnitrophota bacterium]
MTKTISVNLGKRSYQIIIGNKITTSLAKHIKKLGLGNDAIIITNPRVKKIAGPQLISALKKSNISCVFQTVPDSEKSKSQGIAFRLIDKISRYARLKQPFIIALGGGVVGDLAGFVASVYKRGIPYIQLPTTLLAQIDSSIGGKVGIDLTCGKNLVGAFYQPRLVFSDISFLQTLPKNEIRCGLAEAIKYGLIKDKALFEYLEKNYQKALGLDENCLEYIINKCVLIKAKIVGQDEKETKSIRTILNFGHTIGHAIEAAGGFKAYSHGQAVGLGMLAAAEISSSLGLLYNPEKTLDRIKNLLRNIGLPVKIKGLNLEKIIKAHTFDKKFIQGRNRFVLMKQIGQTLIKQNIPSGLITSAVRKLV